jgi:hypothetical protein
VKKIVLAILGLGLAVSAQAKTSFLCGFKDYFHLSNTTPASVFIVNAYSNNDIYVQIVGPRGFELRDTPRCTSGYAQVTVATDASHFCVLEIKDGPYMSSPTVSASCNGMVYKGIRYDGFGTYSYSLNLDFV